MRRHGPTPRCSSRAKQAQEKRLWPDWFTTAALVNGDRSSPSTAPACPTHCWNPSSSVMCEAASPGRIATVPGPRISREAFDALRAHAWSGNVRELRNVIERLVLRANTEVIEPIHLPSEITNGARTREPEAPVEVLVSHRARVDGIFDRMLTQKESFWTTVYPAFMVRDLTRDDLRFIVRGGLEQTRGSYRMLLDLFKMPPQDYKRFLGFLKQHDCHLPFQRFRMLNANPDSNRSQDRPSA